MVVVEGDGAAWAWSGARVAPATGIDATRAYSDVSEPQRWAEARQAEAAWLGVLARGSGLAFAMRYVNAGRRDGLLDSYLLWRAEGRDGPSASTAASTVMSPPPRHVTASALADPDEVCAALNPFAPHASGLAEIRKSITAARCSRPDTNRGVCLAIAPFSTDSPSWEPLWAVLADLPFAAMLTVTLAPMPVGPRLAAGFQRLADEYRQLSNPGSSATAVYHRPLAPDQFAVHAAPLYADAALRYSGSVFTACVTLAAEQPLPRLLAQTLAELVSATVVTPAPGDLATMWGNLSSLNTDPLETAALQGVPPGAVGPLERVLGGIVDVGEAASLFRLPYAVPGHLKLFRELPAAVSPSAKPAGPAAGRDPWLSRFTSGGS